MVFRPMLMPPNSGRYFRSTLRTTTVSLVLMCSIVQVQEQGVAEAVKFDFFSHGDQQKNSFKASDLPLTLSGMSDSANPIKVPLVTGCGRAGTHSVAKYLNSIGIPAVHEGVAAGAVAVSWFVRFSPCPAPTFFRGGLHILFATRQSVRFYLRAQRL